MFDAISNALTFGLLGLDTASRSGAAVHFFIMDVAKIFVLLVVIIYVMGLLRAMVAPERVREFVRGRPDWQARGLRFHWARSRRSVPVLRCPYSSVLSRPAFRWG